MKSARAKATRARLEDPGALADSRVPMAVIHSAQHQTPLTVQRDGPAAVRRWDVDNVAYVPGDLRVVTANTVPPQVPYRVFETPADHGGVLNDHAVVDAALAWLAEQDD